MYFCKRRSWPGILAAGILAAICLIAGSFSPVPFAGMGGDAFAASSPDLSIPSIICSPEHPAIGEHVFFNVTVANSGLATAGESRLLFSMDNNVVESAYISQVDAGGTVTHIFSWVAITGAHNVKMVADADGYIAETDENNNERSYAISVIAPDLAIESLTWSPRQASVGDSVTFTLTARNNGDRVTGGYWVDFLIDSASRGQREMPSLAPGATAVVAYTWITLPGQHTLEASVDVLNQVAENNEANNFVSTNYCTTPPDLIIDALAYSPQARTETGTVTMSVSVKNQGEGASYGAWLNYYVDDTVQKSVYINALEAAASAVVTYPWIPGPDARTFKVIIDPDNYIFESDESNNDRSITLPPLGLPDLSIKSIVWAPEDPAPHTRVNFTVTIANTGFRTVQKCDVALCIPGGIRITRQPGPIPAGSSVETTLQYLTTDTTVDIRAVIDENNYIAESDETNNEATFSLTPVLPQPVADLTVESITCNPASPADGEYTTVSAFIKNLGTGASGPSCVSCYIDNEVIGDIFFGALESGASIERTIRWKAVTGSHIVKLVIDPNQVIFEINEDNNEAVAPLVTSDPDLAVENIQWFPTYPEIGNDLSFTTIVKNQGRRASGACFLTYYIDGIQQGEHYLDPIEPGASASRIFNTDMQADSHTFFVVIDELDTVTESDETNNNRSVIIPAPDLIVKNITSSDDYPVADTTMSFMIAIANTGRSAAAITNTAGYMDGEPLALVETGVLDAGGSAQSVFFWTAQPGKHTLRIITDEANSVPESDETNNVKEVIIFVPMPATTITPEPPVSGNNTSEPPAPPTGSVETTGTAVTAESSALPPAIEEAFQDLVSVEDTANVTEDISGNISATDVPKSGITGVLTNKWLLIGVAVVGIAAICALLVMRKRSGQPKKEKPPKPAKQAKPVKSIKALLPKQALVKPGPVKPGTTLSGKPAVLVPPPPKPGTASVPQKVIVPPDARQNLGATLLKQGNPPTGPTPPPPSGQAAPPPKP